VWKEVEGRKADEARVKEVERTGREERKKETSNRGSKNDRKNNGRKRRRRRRLNRVEDDR